MLIKNREEISMEKEQKVGLRFWNWLLAIGGILLFLSFIVLPPVFRILLPKEEAPIIEEKKNRQMNCMKTVTDGSMTATYQYFLDGEQESVSLISFSRIENYVTVPEEVIQECTSSNATYENQEGLYYQCQVLENQLTLDARVTRSLYVGDALPFMVDFRQNYSVIQEQLMNDGFTCEEVE